MEVREGSMGRPMPGWDIALLDEDEQPVAQGERGEICLRARSNPHYPLGYWRQPEAGEETFGGEWFHTKDAATMDEDGLRLVRRARRRRDHRRRATASARSRSSRPASSIPRSRGGGRRLARRPSGQRRQGVHRAGEGHEPSDELAGEIKRFVRERLSAYAYPRKVEFVDDLPKTLTGKIRRIELRERERERAT
jgi:acetyl-CoA synthetase